MFRFVGGCSLLCSLVVEEEGDDERRWSRIAPPVFPVAPRMA